MAGLEGGCATLPGGTHDETIFRFIRRKVLFSLAAPCATKVLISVLVVVLSALLCNTDLIDDLYLSPPPLSLDTDGSGDGFTVVVNTFRRDECLDNVLRHWLQCRPHQIRVVWNDVERDVPDYLESLAQSSLGLIVFQKWSTNNLTNRFLPDFLATNAVFSIDDDIVFPCQEIWGAYRIWRNHSRQVVGFAPRILRRDGYTWSESYQHWGWNQANAVFITKGGFTHKRFSRVLLTEIR